MMSVTTAIVCLGGMILLAGLIGFALYYKCDVKAGGRIRDGEFYLEAQERKR
jgi:hypothetical protein